jgi:hypothetical protein
VCKCGQRWKGRDWNWNHEIDVSPHPQVQVLVGLDKVEMCILFRILQFELCLDRKQDGKGIMIPNSWKKISRQCADELCLFRTGAGLMLPAAAGEQPFPSKSSPALSQHASTRSCRMDPSPQHHPNARQASFALYLAKMSGVELHLSLLCLPTKWI